MVDECVGEIEYAYITLPDDDFIGYLSQVSFRILHCAIA